jgi:peroxin-16
MLERYKDWVRRNAGLLSLFETGLSSLTWLLPDRFAEGELTIEALHTALGLLSSFHDSIASSPPGAPPMPGGDLLLALSTLEQIQVLLELAATRREERGSGSRYTPLAALEAVKALVRLVAWRRSGSRLLLHGGMGNLEQPGGGLLPPDFPGGSQAVAQGRPQEVYGAFAAFRQRRCRPLQPGDKASQGQDSCGADTAAAAGATEVVAAAAVVTTTAGAAGTAGSSGSQLELMSRQAALADRLVYIGELLHILRPVVYALALRRWGRVSWKPWVLSLAVDLTSIQLGSTADRVSRSASWLGGATAGSLGPSLQLLRCLQQTRWAAEEERELAARRLRLLVYLLRDPLFARYTQAALERWVGGTARIPLLGWLSGRAAEILIGVQRYYTYVERMAS